MSREGCKTLPFPPGSTAYAAYMHAGDGQGAAASQTSTHDNANEITSMSGVALAPLYDQAGSNVRGPRPADANANNAAHFRQFVARPARTCWSFSSTCRQRTRNFR